MPEAIKTLQRALERGREKVVAGGAGVIVGRARARRLRLCLGRLV
jgi:hypothetical protein